MTNVEKTQYSAEYISYIENGDSAIVFITRDVVESIDTKGKWIDVISLEGEKNPNGKWNFKSFEVELFPRKTKPVYPEGASERDKKYITWETANEDILYLRSKKYHGPRYRICPRLFNKNKGKFRTVNALWNKKFRRWVPKEWKTSDCEIRENKIFLEPDWDYQILSIKKL